MLFLPSVFQGIVKELFSQFGSVVSVELMDHPSSVQESGPKLSKFFKPVEKQVNYFTFSVISQNYFVFYRCNFMIGVIFVCSIS